MPPAPWHTGMPLIAPANRLARPRVVAKRPGRTRSAASPKYVRAVSAVAKHELAKDNGNCGSTKATAAAENAAQLRCGVCTAEGPKRNEPWKVTTIATTAITRNTNVIWRRRNNSAAAITTTVATASHQIECRWSANAFGVADTSFHAN